MPLELLFNEKKKRIRLRSKDEMESLTRTYYGKIENGELFLSPEEAMYLIDIRNARMFDEAGNELSFNDVSERLLRDLKEKEKKKFLTRYHTYKDWRERGLIIRPIEEAEERYKRNPVVKYPSKEFVPEKYNLDGVFFDDSMLTVSDNEIGKEIYEKYWIGQYGSYKAAGRGKLLKLDPFETFFMMKYSGLKIRNKTESEIIRVFEKSEYHRALYDVYEDWRLRGFILKTGFKFGTHFRVYFPGAAPSATGKGKKSEWAHSKHVIHVFPRPKRMIIAEWARAIRVAHSVRKTFILAIPGEVTKKTKVKLDYLLYHRKKDGIETPKTDEPSYVMLSLNEDEEIGGAELADTIEKGKDLGLDVMLAIADRETAVTYYHVKRIDIPGSKYKYYEMEWSQP